MIKQFISWFWDQLTLSREVKKLREIVRELQKSDEEKTLLLRDVFHILNHDREKRELELENLALRFQMEMLKFENRLPPRADHDEPKLKD